MKRVWAMVILIAILIGFAGCKDFITPPSVPLLSKAEAEEILSIQIAGGGKYEELKRQRDSDAIQKTVEWFRTQAVVKKSDVLSDGTTIWIEYDSGLEGFIPTVDMFSPPRVRSPLFSSISGLSSSFSVASNGNGNVPNSKRAIILLPFRIEEDLAAPKVKSILESIGYTVDVRTGEDVTVELMRRLDEYGVIYITTHGSIGGITTGEKVSSAKLVDIWNRYRDKSIGIVFAENSLYFAINERFIKGLRFPNSLVFVNACSTLSTLQDSVFAQAFLDSGAGVYLGWTDETFVASWGTIQVTEAIFELLAKPNVDVITAYTTPKIEISGYREKFSVDALYPVTIFKDDDGDRQGCIRYANGIKQCTPGEERETTLWYKPDFTWHGNSKLVLNQVSNKPPTVTIFSPPSGSAFFQGALITFQGKATDPEDGSLTGSSLVWTSSIDGQIGIGESFSRSDLSVGTHTITLTATDSQGLTGKATATIKVEAAVVSRPGCTVTLRPGDLISRAYDNVPSGGVICLTAGRWDLRSDENFPIIQKSLTLRGAGREQTVLIGGFYISEFSEPWGEPETKVTIEDLTVFQPGPYPTALEQYVFLIGGEGDSSSIKVTIQNTKILGGYFGIIISSIQSAIIQNNLISGSVYAGIDVRGRGKIVIQNNQILENEGNGIEIGGPFFIKDEIRYRITNNVIKNNKGYGIYAFYSLEGILFCSGNEVSNNLKGDYYGEGTEVCR